MRLSSSLRRRSARSASASATLARTPRTPVRTPAAKQKAIGVSRGVARHAEHISALTRTRSARGAERAEAGALSAGAPSVVTVTVLFRSLRPVEPPRRGSATRTQLLLRHGLSALHRAVEAALQQRARLFPHRIVREQRVQARRAARQPLLEAREAHGARRLVHGAQRARKRRKVPRPHAPRRYNSVLWRALRSDARRARAPGRSEAAARAPRVARRRARCRPQHAPRGRDSRSFAAAAPRMARPVADYERIACSTLAADGAARGGVVRSR